MSDKNEKKITEIENLGFIRPKVLELERGFSGTRARIMVSLNGEMVVKLCEILPDGRYAQDISKKRIPGKKGEFLKTLIF